MAVGGVEKNYTFKNELAYTEDNVLIHNIFVYNIPSETTPVEIHKYFSSFGKVESVRLVDTCNTMKYSPKIGFIHYTEATSAACVLKHSTPHVLKLERILIKACDSWQQPFVSPTDGSKSNADELNVQQSESCKLTMLNDDCLEYIFKKLVLKDQVRFALTCQRLKNIFEMVCKIEYKTHRMEDLAPLTLWEIREFLLISGAHIEALLGATLNKDRDRIVNFIGKFCPNIKSININSNMSEALNILNVLGKLQNCTVLQLRDCCLTDNVIDALKQLSNLQSLSLAENYNLSGKYMDRLTTVTDLVLYRCQNIQPTHFAGMIESLKDLKSLDIRNCEFLNTSSLSIMVEHSHGLESLKISCSIGSYECITRLPNLKKLELLCPATITLRQQFFQELIKRKSNQLESLKIVASNSFTIEQSHKIAGLTNLKRLICVCANNKNFTDECLQEFANLKNLEEIVLENCISITNEGLLQLVRSCTKLKRVYIQCCTRITDQFVSEVIQVLKSMQNQLGKEPRVFYVAGSGISSDLINDVEYIAAIGLLKLSFEASASLGIEDDYFYRDCDPVCDDCEDYGGYSSSDDYGGYDSSSTSDDYGCIKFFGGYGDYDSDDPCFDWY